LLDCDAVADQNSLKVRAGLDGDAIHYDAARQLDLLLDGAVCADTAVLDGRLVRNLRVLANKTFGPNLQFEKQRISIKTSRNIHSYFNDNVNN
jgi:hypothetical protein